MVGLSRQQVWLWECWEDAWQQIAELKKDLNAVTYVVVNGDAVEGDHHNTFQLHTRNPSLMVSMAVQSLSIARDIADEMFIVRGSCVHAGQSGYLEELVGRELDVNTNENRYTWGTLDIDVDGKLFNFAHNARMGRLPHTFPNALNTLVVTTMYRALRNGTKMPHVMVRSHVHRYSSSGDNYHPYQAYTTPGWKMVDEYVNHLDPGSLPDIGILAFICQETITMRWIGREEYKPRPRAPWRRDGR